MPYVIPIRPSFNPVFIPILENHFSSLSIPRLPFPSRQDSVPYTFPVFEDMDTSRRGFQKWVQDNYLNKAEIRKASLFVCTNPIYYCNWVAVKELNLSYYFGDTILL